MGTTTFRCLVVDDDEAIREICSTVARSVGLECLEAASAEEALLLIEVLRPPFLLTSVPLPGASGLDFIDRAQDLLPELKIGVMTANLSFESAVQAVRLRGFDHVLKPFTIEDLKNLFQRICDEAIPAQPSLEECDVCAMA